MNTKQITRAMKLVSAAKLRRAQDAAVNGRLFANRLRDILAQVTVDLPEGYVHPLVGAREEVKVRRVIVVAGDRGLCGAFNASVFKALLAELAEAPGETEYVLLGRKAVAAAKHWPGKVVAEYESLAEEAALWPTAEIGRRAIADFAAGSCDEVLIYYTQFVSMVRQEVTCRRVLPFVFEQGEVEGPNEKDGPERGKVKYDPQPVVLIEQLVPIIVQTMLGQAALESRASEHAARMRAMDSATRNADELIEKLRLFYNRARQSAITTELIDIVGGAEAQK